METNLVTVTFTNIFKYLGVDFIKSFKIVFETPKYFGVLLFWCLNSYFFGVNIFVFKTSKLVLVYKFENCILVLETPFLVLGAPKWD